jgi:NAD(P)H-hydrate epimerase
MAGAIALAGMATLRSGAGLVWLAVPDSSLEVVAAHEPCYMTIPLPCDDAGRLQGSAGDRLTDIVSNASCVAIGPGLGRSDELVQLVHQLYVAVPRPLVLDADGLNALAAHRKGLLPAAGSRVLTPHPGEFRRLAGSQEHSLEKMREQARQLALQNECVVVLKGHQTLITDGRRETLNQTGNPGMGTGGSGDVLTGIITALVCQGLGAFEAAQLGVHVHGLAGDLAAEQLGQVSMTARDLIDFLPAAFLRTAVG